ncbi:nucleoside hydrolase [Maricaulis sp.]|uniref:nucleoside hydrolase n=1 Tax=Maricaulis sp. TaxID=1486257 RepID=UPI00262AD043|nr:nucleoside hydrolase [Maricaulis sp.]
MTQNRQKVWIDSDGGVDDALALMCAIRSARLDLAGVSTVFGNVAPRKAARNMALVQSLAGGVVVPVHTGCAQPLQGSWRHARHIHGEDGIGGASAGHALGYEEGVVRDRGADAALAAMAGFARGGGTLIALGPLTNLARTLSRAPDTLDGINEIIVMGGALSVPWVRRGGVEFNTGSDLESARGVLAMAPRLTLIPLDICRRVVLRRARLAQMVRGLPERAGRFLVRAHEHYMNAYRASDGIEGCYPHDALAVMAAASPEVFRFETLPLEFATDGEFPGLLRTAPAGRPVRVATGVDQRAALNAIAIALGGHSSD